MATLTDEEIDRALGGLAGWSREGDAIGATYELESFPAVIAFVTRIAELAEAADHHPDLDIRYRRLRIVLSTHSEGGITTKDVELAERIDDAAPVSAG